MRYLLTIILLTSFISVRSQTFYLSLHQAVGFDRQDVTVGSNTTEMSLTSMIGLTAGVDINVVGNFFFNGSAGYHLNAATNRSTMNGNTSKSSHSFNVKRISLGLGQQFLFEDKKASLRLAGGLDLNFPGKLNSKANGDELGTVQYDNATGFFLQIAVPIDVSEKLKVAPSLKYRSYDLNARSWQGGNLEDLNETLSSINGDSIEIGAMLLF